MMIGLKLRHKKAGTIAQIVGPKEKYLGMVGYKVYVALEDRFLFLKEKDMDNFDTL